MTAPLKFSVAVIYRPPGQMGEFVDDKNQTITVQHDFWVCTHLHELSQTGLCSFYARLSSFVDPKWSLENSWVAATAKGICLESKLRL